MSYFKRFTDFCAGFAVFGALLHLIRNFVTFMKDEDISTLKKLKEFLSKENADCYRAYAIIAAVLVASLFIGIILKKFPFVSLAVSSLATVVIVDLFVESRINDRPMFYVALAIIHTVGCLFECVACDREKRLKKLNCTFIAGVVTTFASGALCLFTAYRLSEMKKLFKTADLETFNVAELSFFDMEIFNLVKDAFAKGKDADPDQLILLAVMFIVVLIVTMFIGEIFFVDLTFSLIPLVSVIYSYNSSAFLPQSDMIVTLSMISVTVFFAATLFGTKIEKKNGGTPDNILRKGSEQ